MNDSLQEREFVPGQSLWMRRAQMGPETQELMRKLSEAVQVLEAGREAHWRSWMQDVQRRLADSDYSGIEKLLKAYGGMGSFNDLVLGGTDDVRGTPYFSERDRQLNDRLGALREEMYQLADSIKRDHNIAGA